MRRFPRSTAIGICVVTVAELVAVEHHEALLQMVPSCSAGWGSSPSSRPGPALPETLVD